MGGGEVCVPTSREKSSVGSEQEEASSGMVAVVGMEETIDSSLERREVRWDVVAEASSWRALVWVEREGSM